MNCEFVDRPSLKSPLDPSVTVDLDLRPFIFFSTISRWNQSFGLRRTGVEAVIESTWTNLYVLFQTFLNYEIGGSCVRWRWKANANSWKMWSKVDLLLIWWPRKGKNWQIRYLDLIFNNLGLAILSLFDVVFKEYEIFVENVRIESQLSNTAPLFHRGTRNGCSHSTKELEVKIVG